MNGSRFNKNNLMLLGKFGVVGLMNTIIGYSIFVFLTALDLGPSMALICTYVIAVPINYFSTGKLVFDITSFRSFLLFIVSYVAIYSINLLALTLLIQMGISQILAQALIVPFIAVLSFITFKMLVFKSSENNEKKIN
jgi:putative flippase GtrA